jgi:molecular chaperone GrpE
MTDPREVEELLDRFRGWLDEARADAARPGLAADPRDAEVREVGLYRLVEEFTALRHELKLQTKSARGVQEQAESLTAALGQAVEQFRSVEPKEAQAAWAAGKPLAEALADLDEALDRGRAEIERARRRIVDDAARKVEDSLTALHARQRWPWRRLLRPYHEQTLDLFRRESLSVRRELFDALLEGFDLIRNRLQRSLKAEQVHRIECLGRPVDPDLMTVVEVVDDPDRPPGHAVEEVRRGYTWKGRVLRFAEVRASRSPVI